jgi:hypothetical protein
MHKFYTSSYDASVYLQQPEQNAGRDEMLEVGKLYYGSTKDIARTFVKFNTTNLETGSNFKAFLNLKAANSEEIPLEYTIYANAVSQSWTMGTGTKFDNISSDGISWKYRNGIDSWQDNTIGGTAVFNPGTTGSANAEGGTWYTGSQASQSFNYESDDVRIDVTDILNLWLSSSIPNNGFIVRHGLSNEEDSLDYGLLKFFSKETNTIYEPKLELTWDDSSYVTGSLLPITGSKYADALENTKVVITDLKTEYFENTKNKIRVKGRELYPDKTFNNSIGYDQVRYLPTSSYYQIEDYVTNEIIVPFDGYSKLSCDSKSNYFYLDTKSFATDRVYRLKLKIESAGITKIVDDKLIFKIV